MRPLRVRRLMARTGENKGLGGRWRWGIKHLSDVSLMAGHRSFREPLASSASLGCWGQQEKQSTLTSSLSIFHTHTHTHLQNSSDNPPTPCIIQRVPRFAPLCLLFFCLFCHFFRRAFHRCSLLGSGQVRGRDAALSLCSVSPLSASVRAEEERRRSGAGRERGGYKKKRKKEWRARRGEKTPTHPRRVAANWSAETELAAVVVTLDFKATISESDVM